MGKLAMTPRHNVLSNPRDTIGKSPQGDVREGVGKEMKRGADLEMRGGEKWLEMEREGAEERKCLENEIDNFGISFLFKGKKFRIAANGSKLASPLHVMSNGQIVDGR